MVPPPEIQRRRPSVDACTVMSRACTEPDCETSNRAPNDTENFRKLGSINDMDSFSRSTDKDTRVVLIHSPNCPHCVKAKAVLPSVVARYPNITFAAIDTSEVQVPGVEKIPTWKIYSRRNGNEEVVTLVGASTVGQHIINLEERLSEL